MFGWARGQNWQSAATARSRVIGCGQTMLLLLVDLLPFFAPFLTLLAFMVWDRKRMGARSVTMSFHLPAARSEVREEHGAELLIRVLRRVCPA